MPHASALLSVTRIPFINTLNREVFMRSIHRSISIPLTLIATLIIFLGLPVLASAQSQQAACDQQALEESKQFFNELRLQHIKDPFSVDELDFRLAAADYVEMAEQCYAAEYGEAPLSEG